MFLFSHINKSLNNSLKRREILPPKKNKICCIAFAIILTKYVFGADFGSLHRIVEAQFQSNFLLVKRIDRTRDDVGLEETL